jgi:hypothetical protein
MSEIPDRTCAVCGLPANVHVTDVSDGVARDHCYCWDHAPPEFRGAMPQTPAEEVALLREKLALLDQSEIDPALRATIRAELEQVIGDIEAGRRRLSDLM